MIGPESDREILPLPSWVLYLAGAVVGWVLLAIIYRLGPLRLAVFASIMTGPSVLVLTYFGLGGDGPRRLGRQEFRRAGVLSIVALLSLLAAMVSTLFL